MKNFLVLVLLSLLITPFSNAQNKKVFFIEGTVTVKNTGEPVPYAQVVIKETSQWGVTDEKGYFKIPDIFAGSYTLQSVALGYVTYQLPVTVSRDIKGLKIQMLEDNLTLDEVVVTARSGGTINSSNKIEKQAIEHVQASSIADVMQLLPGNIITNPDLTKTNSIQIRNISDDKGKNSSRGVGFLINGMQINNDASMSSVTGSGKAGIPVMDFRNYSTDNIESIQVLKGVVSAEYGDVTSGAVMITTKAGRTPFELRFKSDPRTKAFSANKGFAVSKHGGYLNVDADYARAASDLRSPVNTYDRTNVGLTYSNTFNTGSRPFRFNARLSGSFVVNSVKSDPDAAKNDFSKIKENNFMLSLYGNWMLNKNWLSALNYNVSASYSHNTARDYAVKTGSVLPTTNGKEEGLHTGYFTDIKSAYDKRIDDIPVYFNAKVSGILNKKAGGTFFKTLLGIEWNSKGNMGDGVYYEGVQPQYFRHHTYREVPFMHNFAAFLDEKVTIPVSRTSLELSAGLRLTKMIVEGYDYNFTLDPRLNARYHIIKNRRKAFVRDFAIRGGWGIMRKLPSLSLLYPGYVYLDKSVFQYQNNTTGESLAVIDTRIMPDRLDYNIGLVRTRNIEIGADINIAGVKIALTYFNEYLKNGLSDNYRIIPRTIKYYNTVTDINAAPKFEDGKIWIKDNTGTYSEAPYRLSDEFIKYNTPDNRSEQRKWGIEYEMDLGRIKPLNTSVLVTGTYLKASYGTDGLVYWYSGGTDPVSPKNEFPYVSIFAGNHDRLGTTSVRDRLSTKISLITNIPKIRMVVSLTTQCIWMDRTWNEFDKGVIYYMDENGKAVYEDFSNRSTDKKLYRDPVAYMDFNGNIKPFSDFHTTGDGDLKRRLSQMRADTHLSYYYAKESYKPYFMANIRVTKEIGRLAAISFYANNFTNSKPMMVNSARPDVPGIRRNTDIYFGAELRLTF